MAINRGRPDGIPYLTEDTDQFMYDQHADEQAGKRRLARVHAVEHEERIARAQALENGLSQEEVPQHPYLDKQLFDGVDINLNIDPTNNPNAKIDLENAQREQQLEMQMRLGLQPGNSFTPKFKPPGAA